MECTLAQKVIPLHTLWLQGLVRICYVHVNLCSYAKVHVHSTEREIEPFPTKGIDVVPRTLGQHQGMGIS